MHKHFEQTSVTQTIESLIGSIPNVNLSLNELREKKRQKFETVAEALEESKDSNLVS